VAFDLATSHDFGIGVPINVRLARKWYHRSLKTMPDHRLAALFMGHLHESGRGGFEPDFAQARSHYTAVASLGSVDAKYNAVGSARHHQHRRPQTADRRPHTACHAPRSYLTRALPTHRVARR